MRRAVTCVSAAIGGVVGYGAFVVAANSEGWQFYTIRSFVTGRKVMSEITMHPADQWVKPMLFFLFVGVGVLGGVLSVGPLKQWLNRGDTAGPNR